MHRYDELINLRNSINNLYEELKILQIFISETIEDIPKTITEKIYDIEGLIESCLVIHSNLKSQVLSSEDIKNKRKNIANFDDIKVKLKEILTCLYFIKFGIESNYKELSYEEINNMLMIILNKSEYIIKISNKTKLKIYPSERTKIKSSARDFNFSKFEISPKNLIKLVK